MTEQVDVEALAAYDRLLLALVHLHLLASSLSNPPSLSSTPPPSPSSIANALSFLTHELNGEVVRISLVLLSTQGLPGLLEFQELVDVLLKFPLDFSYKFLLSLSSNVPERADALIEKLTVVDLPIVQPLLLHLVELKPTLAPSLIARLMDANRLHQFQVTSDLFLPSSSSILHRLLLQLPSLFCDCFTSNFSFPPPPPVAFAFSSFPRSSFSLFNRSKSISSSFEIR